MFLTELRVFVNDFFHFFSLIFALADFWESKKEEGRRKKYT
jgi:hypothetical protein